MPRSKNFDKEEVLEKAVELFWKKGYHATSMQDLVDNLGINRASIYATYGNKLELFNSAIHHYKKKSDQGVLQFFSDQPSVKEGLSKLLKRAIDEVVDDPDHKGCLVVNSMTELMPGDEDIATFFADNEKDIEKILYDFLSVGVESGEISPSKDINKLAKFIFIFFNGLRVISKINSDRESLYDTVDTALSVLD